VPAAAKIELPKRRLIENGDGLDQEAGRKVHGESLFLGKHRLHAFPHFLRSDIFFMRGYPPEMTERVLQLARPGRRKTDPSRAYVP